MFQFLLFTGVHGWTDQSGMPDHYMVGLLNYPNAYTPPELRGHTTGTAKATGSTCREAPLTSTFCDESKGPWNDVPSVGYSDIEFFYDENGVVTGEFWCMSDNGYGSSVNSYDYPL